MLIIGTIVIYKQLIYIQSRDLGFKKDQILIINSTDALQENARAFKNEVLQMNGVSSGTLSGYLPVSSSNRSDNSYSKEAVMDSKNGIDIQSWRIDYDYIRTMGMDIIKGRNFSKDFPSDSNAIIINETTAKFLGYNDPLGKKLYTSDEKKQTISYNIIGVVRNFNYESLRQPIGPLCFFLSERGSLASFKINTSRIQSLINQIESKWRALAPSMPFSYRFMDQSFDEMYRAEQRMGKISMIFSILAILIACLGLFGLAAFVAEQRTKEVGIRKVLGASVQGIVRLLSKDFIILVGIAFVISTPFAWWAMHKWLSDFAYRIDMPWWIFGLAGVLAAMIALITVSFQAIRAAIANPVQSLRTE